MKHDSTILDDLERVTKMSEGAGILITTIEVCEYFNVSERTIQTWINKHGMPVAEKGGAGKPNKFWSAEVFFWNMCRKLKEKFGEIPRDFLLEWERDWLLTMIEQKKQNT